MQTEQFGESLTGASQSVLSRLPELHLWNDEKTESCETKSENADTPDAEKKKNNYKRQVFYQEEKEESNTYRSEDGKESEPNPPHNVQGVTEELTSSSNILRAAAYQSCSC